MKLSEFDHSGHWRSLKRPTVTVPTGEVLTLHVLVWCHITCPCIVMARSGLRICVLYSDWTVLVCTAHGIEFGINNSLNPIKTREEQG